IGHVCGAEQNNRYGKFNKPYVPPKRQEWRSKGQIQEQISLAKEKKISTEEPILSPLLDLEEFPVLSARRAKSPKRYSGG
ncbi:hypothetical protein HAX54_026601, partial [Datura stramonium]|nr:hypothetical protein [Datura stramonium]